MTQKSVTPVTVLVGRLPLGREILSAVVLHLHRAPRADVLAGALAQLLATPAGDPFAAEVVAVPTRGMERWLTQRMSAVLGARPGRADGICANVVFPSPHRLITDAVAAASGIDPDSDPWLPERAVWPLLDVVAEHIDAAWLDPLAAYLGAGIDDGTTYRSDRRLTVVRHLAALFHRYALHRPEMVRAWREGADTGADGAPLPAASVWQAELWRRLRARIGSADLAERVAGAEDALGADPTLVDLPGRLALFGLTRLPAGHLTVLRALAGHRDLHLFLLHPSAQLWETVGSRLSGGAEPVRRRASDPTADAPANRLLASWGRDAREMQLVLAADGEHADHAHEAPSPPDTLLGAIQADIRADRPAPGPPLSGMTDERPMLAAGDRSVEVHSCHGRARQVEVIRDAVLHALADDPTLEPRDVIVMSPDIEAFAPLIQATFGAGDAPAGDQDLTGTGGEAVTLRVRLADRALRQTNPVLGVVSELLELTQRRLTASEMLDLADRGPVRRRFRFDDDDLTRLQDWIAQAGIRWGLDAPHRRPYRLDAVDNGTWQTGLDRILLGVTMTEDGQRLVDGVLPLDDVDSRAIDLAGRCAELVGRVGTAVTALATPQPLPAWAQAIAEAADSLTATAPRDRWQRAELQRVLDEMTAEAGDTAGPSLSPAELRAHLAERLAGRPTRANFRTGHLTVCTLMPMRSVPHRVVCLLGLDDGAFPRKAPRDGDDLMLADPHVGERDPRSEDRQLLLDAVLAATERVIVTYTGNDERTNAPRPPAVPVGELLDTADATARAPEGRVRDAILVRHPLQPFDPRNFTPGGIAGDGPWSFDAATLTGTRALAGVRSGPPPFLSASLPPDESRVVELADLVRFLEHPVRAFLRRRLGISVRETSDEIADELPVELDGLGRWGVGQRLLDARLRGVQRRTALLAEIARGTLPPEQLGSPLLRDLDPIVDAIVSEATARAPALAGGDPVDVRVTLADGRLLSGTVSQASGDVLLATTFSRISAKHRIAAWARLLAVTASAPERAFTAVTIGRAGGRDDVRTAVVGPLGDDADARRAAALEQLQRLVDIYDRGMREPLPLFCQTSAAYAGAVLSGQDAEEAGRRAWESEWNFDHEDREPEHQLAFGGVRSFAEILAPAPEPGEAWVAGETSRLGAYAVALWEGLLAREAVSSR